MLEFRPVSQRHPRLVIFGRVVWKGCFFRETELGHGDDIAAQNEHKTKTNVGTSIWACEHGRPDVYLSPTCRCESLYSRVYSEREGPQPSCTPLVVLPPSNWPHFVQCSARRGQRDLLDYRCTRRLVDCLRIEPQHSRSGSEVMRTR